MSNKKEVQTVSGQLTKQVNGFIKKLETYNSTRQFPREAKDYSFLRDFYIRFLEDRNKRAAEVTSTKYAKVRALANAQFPFITLWNLCMDGRVLAVLINGASAGVGSSVRVPGGLLREFVYGEDGRLFLMENSNFAFLLKRALKKFKTKKIFEIYDSHVGCAARKGEEMAHGKIPQDAGLLADVIYKKQMAEATIEFVQKHFEEDIQIVPIQTSFDPHQGFMYMGLETTNALSFAKKNGGEYTEDVLKDLVSKKYIISTENLIYSLGLSKVFSEYAFVLDWKGKYTESAQSFWDNVASLKFKVLPQIKKELVAIYPELSGKSVDAKDELDERAMLLLTNAYSGYLNNKMQNIASHTADNQDHTRYPYGVHREEGIKVSEGGYPPYDISMFVVFSLDKENLPASIELAATLVRMNRRERRVIDRSGVYADPQVFVEAPVPVVVQEIIREPISESEWELVSGVDWDDLPENWDTMSTPDFYEYLQTKTHVNIAIANGLNRLRERMAVLYNPVQPTSGHLIQHYKVAMPVIFGSNRKNYFIVPFVKFGFKTG